MPCRPGRAEGGEDPGGHEQQADQEGDAHCGAAHDEAEPDPEQADQGEVARDRDRDAVGAEDLCWPVKKAANAATSMAANPSAANTTSFALRTGSSLGTVVNVARIMPVAYSPVIDRPPALP